MKSSVNTENYVCRYLGKFSVNPDRLKNSNSVLFSEMENGTNRTMEIDRNSSDDEVNVITRGVFLTLCTAITLLSLWIVIILLRCKHTAPQFKLLYSNLFVSDGVFGITLMLHLVISEAPLPVCVFSFVIVTGTYNVYLFTVIVMLLDRVISLWKVTPFLIRLTTKSVATIVLAIWLVSILIKGMASLDGFHNFTRCSLKIDEQIGSIGSLALFSIVTVLIILCVALIVAIVILQRKHLQIMTNAPVEMRRHIIGEYMRSALKEISVCALTLLLYVPWMIRHVTYVTGIDRKSINIFLVVALMTMTVKLFSSLIICAIRFPEFRYKMPSAIFPCCREIQSWSAANLEIYFPTIPDVNDPDVDSDFGIHIHGTQVSPVTNGSRTSIENDIALRNSNRFNAKIHAAEVETVTCKSQPEVSIDINRKKCNAYT